MTKTIIVGGYGPGIATSVAEKFGSQGYAVALVARNAERLAAGVKALEAKGIKFDVPYREVPAIELKIAYITDPNGVYIELTEGYDKY